MKTVLTDTLMITAFVTAMMILVEYLNVLSQGRWRIWVSRSRASQYLLAAALGATPGCLGAFVVVALYMHRSLRLGALVAAMIATSGDEAFVMLALFPRTAALMMLTMALLGIAVGYLTDTLLQTQQADKCPDLVLHPIEEDCRCFDLSSLPSQWRQPSVGRAYLSAGCALFVLAILLGMTGPTSWGWMRVTLLLVSLFALFVVSTVPEHFLREHLLEHVIQRHVPRIFAWTLGALAAMALLNTWVHVAESIRNQPWLMLAVASAVGIIPESGPHMFFVTLFSKGLVPLGVIMASSIVQDGHGMLPLLAYSRRDFLKVKSINLIVGLIAGSMLLWLGA